ncbi:hypothetical protein FB451DRAFT_1368587 [Mycena latifolia]|nr:hypothetical protein FB451DRAFT_1368587 [Mycena latifolia]
MAAWCMDRALRARVHAQAQHDMMPGPGLLRAAHAVRAGDLQSTTAQDAHTPNPADTRARAALLPGLACTVATAQRHMRSREALLVDVDAPANDGRTAIDEIGAWYTVHDRDVASRSRELGREADSSGGGRGVFRMMSESWKRGTMGLAEGQR